jgi:hypothetical protein
LNCRVHNDIGVLGALALGLALVLPGTLGGEDRKNDRLRGSNSGNTESLRIRVVERSVKETRDPAELDQPKRTNTNINGVYTNMFTQRVSISALAGYSSASMKLTL